MHTIPKTGPTWALSLLLLTSCDVATEPLPPGVQTGTYMLERIDDRALPTVAPCGVYDVREGHISLKPGRRARYTLRYGDRGTGEEIHYTATGSYRWQDGSLVLALRGAWSHQGTTHDQRIALKPGPAALLQERVGAACDASSTKHFRFVPPA